MLTTITSTVILDWQDARACQLWMWATSPFMASDGTMVQSASPLNDGKTAINVRRITCTVDTGAKTCAIPAISNLYATTDALDDPYAHLSAAFFTPTGTLIKAYESFEDFALPALALQTWKDIRTYNNASGSSLFRDTTVFNRTESDNRYAPLGGSVLQSSAGVSQVPFVGSVAPSVFAGDPGFTWDAGRLSISGLSVSGAITVLNANNAGLWLGHPSQANTPYIDWFSSGNATYDTRLIASGGDGTGASGQLNVQGVLDIAPKSGTLLRAIQTGQVASGVVGIEYALNSVIITDTVAAGGAFVDGLQVLHSIGGGATTGGRQTLAIIMSLAAPTNPSSTNDNYVAGTFWGRALSGDGGVLGSEKGRIFGVGAIATLATTSTNMQGLVAAEFNVTAPAGSSVLYKAGLTISATTTDAVHGSGVDAALSLSNQGSAIGWTDGILFGSQNGAHPISTTGNLWRLLSGGTVNKGLAWGAYTFTDSSIEVPGFKIDGSGNPIINNALSYKGKTFGGVVTPVLSVGSDDVLYLGSTSGWAGLVFQPGAADVAVRILPNGNFGIGMAGVNQPSARLHVSGLTEHADNAAALAASLTAGAFYYTGDVVKYVH